MQTVRNLCIAKGRRAYQGMSEEIWGVTGDQIALRIVPIWALPQHAGL
jgi:hypothetical protein